MFLASASVIAKAVAHVLALTALPCKLDRKKINVICFREINSLVQLSYIKFFTLTGKVSSCGGTVAGGAVAAVALPPGGVFCVVYGLLTSMRWSSSEIEQFVPLKMETASEGPAREPL